MGVHMLLFEYPTVISTNNCREGAIADLYVSGWTLYPSKTCWACDINSKIFIYFIHN